MRKPKYGELQINNCCSVVREIWYSRDADMCPLPVVDMEEDSRDPADIAQSKIYLEQLVAANKFFTERDKRLLVMRYVLGMTLEEVGAETGTSGSLALCRIEKAKRKLRYVAHVLR